MKQRKYEAAEEISRQVVDRAEMALGAEDTWTLWFANYLGSVLHKQHKYDEAEKILRRV